MLEGIENMHNVGFVHRDIRPGNFCLEDSDENDEKKMLYIIDFGLSVKYLKANGIF